MKRSEYFPVLDSMRFVAAMAVFFTHSVAFFNASSVPFSLGPLVNNGGYYGVLFFYTLSGFLITFLLLREKDEMGTIALRKFYIRRAWRIWPLYYLMTILSFVVLPHLLPGAGGPGWLIAFFLYLLMLPNIAMMTGYSSAANFQLYTIGFEEQFYLCWPLLVRKASSRPVGLLAVVFFAPLGLSLFHAYAHARHLLDHGGGWLIVRGVLTYIDYSCIPAFAAGGAAAYWYRRAGEAQLGFLRRKVLGYLAGGGLLLLMWFGKPWTPGYVNLISLVFVLLILHLVIRRRRLSMVGRLFASGGRISYGIYVYHPVMMMGVSLCLSRIRMPGSPMVNYLVFTLLSFVCVLAVAALSYRFFERRFLQKRPTEAIFQGQS